MHWNPLKTYYFLIFFQTENLWKLCEFLFLDKPRNKLKQNEDLFSIFFCDAKFLLWFFKKRPQKTQGYIWWGIIRGCSKLKKGRNFKKVFSFSLPKENLVTKVSGCFFSSTYHYAIPIPKQVTQWGNEISCFMSNSGRESTDSIWLDQGWIIIGIIRDRWCDNSRQWWIFQHFNHWSFEISSSWKLYLQSF